MHYQLTQYSSIHANFDCPFCRQTVLSQHAVAAENLCQHLLFVALDLGFEFVSDRFEHSLSLSIDQLHEQEPFDFLQSLESSSLQRVRIYQMPLGVANLYHYLGFLGLDF